MFLRNVRKLIPRLYGVTSQKLVQFLLKAAKTPISHKKYISDNGQMSSVARQRLGKHIPEAYTLNDRASIAR
jgi:hypothetical protein